MRVFLNNNATVKSLKLAYAADSITISGTIAAVGHHAMEHEHELLGRTPPELAEDEHDTSVPEHSFDPVILPGTLTEVAVDAADTPFSKTISFADLKALPGFACYSQLAFGIHFATGEVTMHETYSRSYRTKRKETSMDKNCFYVLHILVPCVAVKSFDECMVVCTASKATFEANAPFDTLEAQEDFRSRVPVLAVDGPDGISSAGGKFKVSYKWPDGTPIAGAYVHAEVTAGYINRQRTHTNAAGEAYFTVLPLALDKGEGFRVKFGFKHFTGKVEKAVSVSA